MEDDRRYQEEEQATGEGKTVEAVKALMLDKLHQERQYWQERLEQEQKSNEKALLEVKKASNILLSAVVRSCGIKLPDKEEVYTLSIPMPQDGYYTAGYKHGGNYVLRCAPKMEL